MLAGELSQKGLEHLHDGCGRHDAHADHRHLVENDGVISRRAAGHLLSGIGQVERIGGIHGRTLHREAKVVYDNRES